MDLYSICAYYWEIGREDAQSRIICWFYTKVTRDMNDCMQLNWQTLDYIPSEARAEALAFHGIVVGDS